MARTNRLIKARPSRGTRSDFLTLQGLAGLGWLTPAEAEARVAAQKSEAASKEDAYGWKQSDEAERIQGQKSRDELYTSATSDTAYKAPDLFEIINKPYKEKYEASIFSTLGEVKKERGYLGVGELVLPMMAYNGLVFPNMKEERHVAALGQAVMCALSGIDFDFEGDEQLAWGWGNITRMFTPPARIMQKLKIKLPAKLKPPAILSKAIRFAGAISTLPLTLASGKLRNQVFGLKGNEMKIFDQAAKVGRITAVAVATVVGAPAILGSMSGTAANGLGTGLTGPSGGFLGKFIGSKVGSFLIKDAAKDMVWRVTKDALGKIVGEKFNKDQIPPEEYAAMPDAVPVPSATEPDNTSQPPMVAGTSSMGPSSNESGMPEPEGQEDPFSQSMRDQSASDIADTRLNPEDRSRFLDPNKTGQLVAAITEGKVPSDSRTAAEDRADRILPSDEPDDTPLTELIARARANPDSLESEVIDGEPSLRATAAYIRRTGLTSSMPALRKAPMGWKRNKAKKGKRALNAPLSASDAFSKEAEKRRLQRLYKIVHE